MSVLRWRDRMTNYQVPTAQPDDFNPKMLRLHMVGGAWLIPLKKVEEIGKNT